MPSLFTEDTYEQAIIELFENMGYDHLYAPDMERDYSSPLLAAVLRDSLVRINLGLPVEAINEAITKLKNFDTGSFLKKNIISVSYTHLKALGRKVKGYNDGYWNGVRQLLVYEGLKEKFAQHEDLKRQLLDTEDSILAECAVNARIWGIGLSMKDSNRLEPEKWRGQNLLGYALMMVRNWIKE